LRRGASVAIAGVIGGKLTEVTSSQKKISFGVRIFRPGAGAAGVQEVKISTESGYRLKRSWTLRRRARFFARGPTDTRWGTGEDTSGLMDKDHSPKAKKKPVLLRVERVQKVLGLSIPQARIGRILRPFRFRCKTRPGKLKVAPEIPAVTLFSKKT